MKKVTPLVGLMVFILTVTGCAPLVKPSPVPGNQSDNALIATKVADILTQSVQLSTPAGNGQVAPESPGDNTLKLAIVYQKSGNIWAWIENSRIQLTTSGNDKDPKLSDDKRWVAFLRGSDLWVTDLLGKDTKQVFAEPTQTVAQFEFVPGGHSLYLNTAATARNSNDDLYMVDADSGLSKIINGPGYGGQINFSPDGKMLALVKPDKISVLNIGEKSPVLTYGFIPTPVSGSAGFYLPPVVWMEAGMGLKTIILGTNGAPAKLLLLLPGQPRPAQLAQFHPVAPDVTEPYISPDGSQVVYGQEKNNNLEIRVVDVSTADRMLFSHAIGKLGLLGWSPDSKGVLFWVDDDKNTWLYSDGSQAPLVAGTQAEQVTWIDGHYFLFMTGDQLSLGSVGGNPLVIDSGVSGRLFSASGK